MIVLEQLMRDKEIPKVPIYLDGMIWEATAIHTAYPEFLNSKLRAQTFQKGKNPLLSDVFVRVDGHEMRQKIIDDTESCIVLATSGMMVGGICVIIGFFPSRVEIQSPVYCTPEENEPSPSKQLMGSCSQFTYNQHCNLMPDSHKQNNPNLAGIKTSYCSP